MLDVYLYSLSDDFLDITKMPWCSSYVRIRFDNSVNFPGDIVSDVDLSVVEIDYQICAAGFERIAEADMISLWEAEWMLKNGYAFGNPICQLCIASQEKIDFSDYDYVGFEYVTSRHGIYFGKTIYSVLFYTFYKYIGDAENGNQIYAKTYVCAIGVSGIREYFQSLEKAHHKD